MPAIKEQERTSAPLSPSDYHVAEGFTKPPQRERIWREWMMVAVGLTALVAFLGGGLATLALFTGNDGGSAPAVTVKAPAAAAPAAADKPAPTLAAAKGMAFEKFRPVDPTLPAVPAGAVKTFTVDVFQHVTQVSKDLAPTEAWSYAINGVAYRGTAASPPIVVNQGDKVQITFVNGTTKKMAVDMAHSIDFHAAEVAPNRNYVDVAPGKRLTIRFDAKHPGVFMYHCATQPVLMHTSAGMVGMMVVKPKNLPPVDKELWLTQEEFYLGAPGKPADMAKMAAEKPDVMAFNGYANQYKDNPITVRRGEKVRIYVLDAGPSKWSAFHVIGTVFDTTHVEGVVGHDSQTVSFAPSQGGWVEFTLDQEGNYPFVTHAFGDMVKGAAGILHTAGAPKPAGPEAAQPKAAAAGGVGVTMGDMWIKATTPTVRAGKVTFNVKNTGATMHGLGVVPAPAKVSGGSVVDSAMVAEGKHLSAGQSETVTANLKPGRYELVCHMPGHYAAGQHMAFTVR
jgi:uncharacterized cupredoxin-like copper-binding protein